MKKTDFVSKNVNSNLQNNDDTSAEPEEHSVGEHHNQRVYDKHGKNNEFIKQ